MCFAPALANFALRFGPPEYFGLALMSFGLLTVFGGDQPIKSIVSTLMGLFIATIGPRYCGWDSRFRFRSATVAGSISS
jgi:putative tricarboxylic transport membrane protein